MLIAPSILAANFGKLEEEIKAICECGCDLVHIDVMDGHFVPNLTIGPVVVESVAKASTKPLDIHLMVQTIIFLWIYSPLLSLNISLFILKRRNIQTLLLKKLETMESLLLLCLILIQV